MKTVDISGMGGGYELCCQTMLLRGIAFLAQNPDFTFDKAYSGFKGVYGLCMSKNENAKTLDEVITKGTDCTGAMHQAVIGHLSYIHKNGYEKWLSNFEDEPDRIYEIDVETLENNLKIEMELWEAKLKAGYDPLKNLKDIIPEDQWIKFDPENPNEAVTKIVKLMDPDHNSDTTTQ
jgi:hypothetical protein